MGDILRSLVQEKQKTDNIVYQWGHGVTYWATYKIKSIWDGDAIEKNRAATS
jgi:hypothetical protein